MYTTYFISLDLSLAVIFQVHNHKLKQSNLSKKISALLLNYGQMSLLIINFIHNLTEKQIKL